MSMARSVSFLSGLTSCLVCAAAFVCAVVAHSQSPTADEATIRSIIQSQQDAWNAGDAKAFAAHASQDCLFTNIVGKTFVGRADFQQRHAAIFTTVYAGSHLQTSIRTFQMLTPDVAIVESEWAVRGFKALPPGIHADADGALYSELEEVFVKRSDGWEIASFHNVDRKPIAPPSTP